MTEAIQLDAAREASGHDAGLREKTEALLGAGQRDAAIQTARTLLREEPGIRTWRFLRKVAESAAATGAGLKPLKVALLSSFAIELAHDALIAYGFVSGLRVTLYQAGFGSFRQELLDPASGLYGASPDVIVLAVEGEEWVPKAYGRTAADAQTDSAAVVRNFGSELRNLLAQLRSRSAAPLLVHNFAPPPWRSLGILDAGSTKGQARLVESLNAELAAIAESGSDVHVVDYAGLVHRHGYARWNDARMRLYARAPIALPMLGELAREYSKFFRCLVGFGKKCLVLDLDNTLWGGVVGEDGVEGIALGETYPGNAYVEFQHHVLALHQRGVILAIASKNNPSDADEVFAGHRSMVLKKEHFAEMQVHWDMKSVSLRRIAASLGIGLEHVVFADDNPAECEQVRGALPMVTVIQLPAQPERYVEALLEDGWFDVLALSGEDLRRDELYRQRAEGEALRGTAGGVEQYYRALDMELRIAAVDRASVRRAAQLTQKTNQLNVTTRRYTEGQLTALAQDREWVAMTYGVSDRFGDNGIVGLVLARVMEDTLCIDTFLLSCRVISRGVETAMLAHLCDIAEERGLRWLAGELIPTSKNMPVRDLFERHGFEKRGEEDGATTWRIAVPDGRVRWPDWFRVRREASLTPAGEQ